MPTSNESCGRISLKIGSRHCAAAFSLHVPKSCTDLYSTLLYISIRGTCSKFVRENKMLALGVCLPQPCPSAGRSFTASRSRLNHYWQFFWSQHNNELNELPCKLDSTAYARSFRTRPNPTWILRFISQRCADDGSRAGLAWAPWFSHCNRLQHIALHCNTLQHTAIHCNTLQHIATHCHTLPHSATHGNTLQHTAAHLKTGLVHKDTPIVGLEQRHIH